LVATSPLSTGDIVGRCFRIFRQNLPLICKSLLLPTIILCLGRIALLVGVSFGVKYVNNVGAGLSWILLACAGGLVALVGLLFLWVKQLVLVRYLTGIDDTFQEAQAFVRGRILSLILLCILTFLASTFMIAAWAVVMVLAFPPLQGQGFWPVLGSFGMAAGIFGLIFSAIFVSLVYNLSSIGLTLEKGDLGDLIGEGFGLTVRSFWRSIGFLFMTTTAVTLVAYPLSLPMILFIAGYMVVQGAALGSSPESALPMSLQVFNSVWETAVNMIIGPIYYLAYALYYRDLRMRQEGLDLVERLKQVDQQAEAGRLGSHGI
jgi:hypothetical protein